MKHAIQSFLSSSLWLLPEYSLTEDKNQFRCHWRNKKSILTQTAASELLLSLSDSTFLSASSLVGRYMYVQPVRRPILFSIFICCRVQKQKLTISPTAA